ncbi:MAG: hypothetical protein QOH06_5853 [Acidobacteriota bacterium]|jgi:beta-lactamase regulating signal transducer with metallopeptidase domain|nr:hypothetical protein [Acidobacteriota bacterium]
MFENLMNQASAWLLTYSLHSTLFLALAWLVSTRLAGRRARLEEAIWRFALVAALVTATVQLAAGLEPVAGRWTLNAPAAASSVEVASRPVPAPSRAALPVSMAVRAESPRASLPSWPLDLRSTVLGLWALGALFLCLRWAGSYLRLKRRLRARPEVVGGGMFALMRQLSGDLGLAPLVRLTCSSRVSVPVALGLGRPEICVPPRALSHLEPEQQEGMLAHELAHLVRRDPFWLAFSRMLAGALFFQPLNWIACRRLRELSERLCDEWAVERTGRPLSLARCLAEVAGWSVRSVSSLPVPSMADRPSSLARRIRHLLDDSKSPERRVRPVWVGAGMLVLLAAVATVAPGVYAAVAVEEPRQEAIVDAEEAVEPEDPAEPAYEIVDDEIEARVEGELAGMEAELEGMDAGLEAALAPLEELGDMDFDFDFDFDGMAFLSEEEAEEIGRMAEEVSEKYAGEYAALAESMMADMEPELERISEEVNSKLAPEIERISEEVNRDLMPEIERISERVANEMEPELERLRADAERLRREGGLSAEERERIRSQAREISRRARPSDEEMKAIRDSQRKYRDEMRKFMEDHREEMEAMRSEARAHSEAMRDQIRQRMDADPKFRELRERHRRDMEQIRERHREEMREHREKMKQDKEKNKEKDKDEKQV